MWHLGKVASAHGVVVLYDQNSIAMHCSQKIANIGVKGTIMDDLFHGPYITEYAAILRRYLILASHTKWRTTPWW